MIEILWHGRGGQGAFTAARLLGAAGSLAEGRYALAFPSFGPERRGAPMRAFTKIDAAVIGDRSAIKKADFVVYLDDTLFGDGWANEVKPGGYALVNSTLPSVELTARFGVDDATILAIDANALSSEILGRPIPNTVFLGAVAALSDAVSVADLEEAVRQYMAPKLHEKNFQIIRAAAAKTEDLLDACASCVDSADGRGSLDEVAALGESAAANEGAAPNAREDGAACGASDEASRLVARAAAVVAETVRPMCAIPTLRAGQPLTHDVYARATCYEAGYLVSKNAGWRNIRPVVDYEKCTSCLQCYMQCPDGTIFKVPGQSAKGSIAIDYDFCKGCGVCVKACSFDALSMVSEAEALATEKALHDADGQAASVSVCDQQFSSNDAEGQVNA